MSHAERQRRYRERRKAGLRMLTIAVSDELVAEAVRRGLIAIGDTEHDPDLEEAIGAALSHWILDAKKSA